MAEQRLGERRIRCCRSSQGDGQFGLAGDTDVQVRRAVSGKLTMEDALQPAPQCLGHRFAPDESPQLIARQVHVAVSRRVKEVGEKRRVSADDITRVAAQQLYRGE